MFYCFCTALCMLSWIQTTMRHLKNLCASMTTQKNGLRKIILSIKQCQSFLKKHWDKMITNIAESFNAQLREEHHQIIYTFLLIHMDKHVGMLDTHMCGAEKWISMVGPKTKEKLKSNIMRSGLISVMPYLGGTYKVFTSKVCLVVDMQQCTCTCMTWKMSRLPCAHVCAIICTVRHDVYEYIDPFFHASPQHLI